MKKTYFLLGSSACDAFQEGGMTELRKQYNRGNCDEPRLITFEEGVTNIADFAEAVCGEQGYCILTEEEYNKIKKAYKL